jgi:CelD/BcsL family acetyltransferase involved in cellulose biosynthesis
MNRVSARFSCAVLTDCSSLAQVEGEWNALYDAMSAPYLSDSFEWAWLSWNLVGKPRRRKPLCLVVRRLSSVVAIFPLVVSRRGIWRIATPLNSEGSEYCPFLIDPRVSPVDVMEAVFATLRDVPNLHGLYLPKVREDEPLGLWLARRADAVRILTLPTARIRFDGCADWDSYFATRSSHMRAELRRKERSAERLGDVRFCEVTDQEERQEIWRWLVSRKRAALARRGMRDWLLAPSHVEFAAETLKTLDGRRPLFAIKLDGAVIAAGLCSVDATRLEGFVMAYDESYSRISPGALLQMHCARWALSHGLDFDLRTGDEGYKSRWANDFSQVSSFALALTPWGWPFVAGERVRRWAGLRMPQSLRTRLWRLGWRPASHQRTA